jgi:hypothetical protein
METHILDRSPDAQPHVKTFDGPLGRAIIETHIWAVREGLSGATAHDLFDGYCQRLVVHRAGAGCLNSFSASISGASAGVRLPSGGAAA